jgi:GT2 family glycosyltransferase
MRPAKIIIVLLNWNGKNDTIQCLHSLEKLEGVRFQPIVVDNGSTDGSVPALRAAFPTLPIFEMKQNLGFAAGNNFGIQWALSKHAEWILLLNNDTTVAPDLLTSFLAAAKEQPTAKILGAKILHMNDPARIDHLGGMWNPKIAEFTSIASGQIDSSPQTMQRVDYVCGAALFMHRSVPEAIGLLEPRFFLFWEETDYCFRAMRAGFEVWTAPNARVWHKVSASFSGGKPHMHYFWWRSRLLWLSRNCTREEQKKLYRSIIWPELFKAARHYLLRGLQNFFTRTQDPYKIERVRRHKAACIGALHFFRKRFGNCPGWLVRK